MNWFQVFIFAGIFAVLFFSRPVVFAPLWLREFFSYLRDDKEQSLTRFTSSLSLIMLALFSTNLIPSVPHYKLGGWFPTPLVWQAGESAWTIYVVNVLKYAILNRILNFAIMRITPSKHWERAFAQGLLRVSPLNTWSLIKQVDFGKVNVVNACGITTEDYRKRRGQIAGAVGCTILHIIPITEREVQFVVRPMRKNVDAGEFVEVEPRHFLAIPKAKRYCYIIGNPDFQYCKIGGGKEIAPRLAEAQRWIPNPHVLFYAVDGKDFSEKSLHRKFKLHKIETRGEELFEYADEIRAFVEIHKVTSPGY